MQTGGGEVLSADPEVGGFGRVDAEIRPAVGVRLVTAGRVDADDGFRRRSVQSRARVVGRSGAEEESLGGTEVRGQAREGRGLLGCWTFRHFAVGLPVGIVPGGKRGAVIVIYVVLVVVVVI